MVKVRAFRDSDVLEIDRIWREHHANDFSVPDRRNAIIEAVVEKEGKVIGYGQLKHFAEAMMILDLNASQRDKIQALKLMMLEAFRGADQSGLRQLYCFIHDPDFAALLSRHFGFDIIDKGQLLFREEV